MYKSRESGFFVIFKIVDSKQKPNNDVPSPFVNIELQ